MLDLFTYLVYLSLLVTVFVLTYYGRGHRNSLKDFNSPVPVLPQIAVALIALSVVVGFRHDVGVDWEGYKRDFEQISSYAYSEVFSHPYEPGYFLLNKLVSDFGLSHVALFALVALISWGVIFKAAPRFVLPLFVLFLFLDEFFFWSMNGVRQFVAMSIWLLSIRYIARRDLLQYILLIITASLFHLSSLFLLPIYFLPFERLYRPLVWAVLFCVTLIIGSSEAVVQFAESLARALAPSLGLVDYYTERYIDRGKFIFDENVVLGLGFWFRILVNFALIIASARVLRLRPEMLPYFVIFFIGAVIFNLTYGVQTLGRLNNYFLILRPLLLAITVEHYWRKQSSRPWAALLVAMYFVLFCFAIYRSSNMCCPIQFSM